MTLDISKSLEIIETMENYMSVLRPEPELRQKIDYSYEIIDQSIILNENNPDYDNPEVWLIYGYAKATYIKKKDVWKIFWKRADDKWHAYTPNPTVKELKDFLKIVDEDKYHCFKG